ncbi:MAG TPA: M56 family metallopeptidase, partial [Gemmataceae bacterium]|nr:M56 family metallopeptidase [Gemmataceae bacterium]
MNGLGTSLIWGAVQVSLFCLVGAFLYLLCRRRGPSAGALVALVAVLLVLGISILALSPWPHWLELSPQSTDAVAAVDKAEPVMELEDGASSMPVAKAETGAIPLAPTTRSTLQDGRALWKAAWTGMIEGLNDRAQTPVEQGWRWPALLACLLLSGMAIGLVRLLLGLATVSRYRRFSCPLDDPELADLLAITQAELRCAHSIAIHESAALDTPAVVGWLRPMVLLPESWRNWTREELQAVLGHEVAHIAHNDYASWVLAQVSLIVNFYNPFVHWLVTRLRIEQELAADGCGARLTGGNQTYLTILAGMALRLDNRQASWAARPFLPARGTFLRRIEMLRDAKSVGQPQLAIVSRVLVVGVLSAAALIAAGVRTPIAGGDTNLISSGTPGLSDGEKTPITGEFIPPNAMAAIAIRVPDLLRQLGNKELKAQIDEFSPLKQMGIHVEDLEEVKLA